ncbi:MAG: PRC-barrel domain-containing protein [Prosthecobacter sp.]
MKRKLNLFLVAFATSVMAFSALAKDALKTKSDRLNGASKATEILGITVKNKQNEKIGKVEDLTVDVASGRIIQVILSTSKYTGCDGALTAVPPGALHHDAANKILNLDAGKEKLMSAPKFEMAKWAEESDTDHLFAVYRHFGEEKTFTFIQNGRVVLNDKVGTGESLISAARPSQIQMASKLIGTPVKNLQEEKLGTVDNLQLDLPAGRVVAVIVSSGGFLGMGDELSAVPSAALLFTKGRDMLQLDASKEMLSSAPHFKVNQWPDFAQTSYANGIYQAYKIEPYFTTEVDNTARNVRDGNVRTLTPLDQGNSQSDVNITAQIRKQIIADKKMTVNAQNVKIITQKGACHTARTSQHRRGKMSHQ